MSSSPASTPVAGERTQFTHLSADFTDALPAQLRDRSLLGGLMVAAAGAAGLVATAPPSVTETRSEGVAAILLLDSCHLAVHTFPERRLLLLDVIANTPFDPRKVLEVFARRMTGAKVRHTVTQRG